MDLRRPIEQACEAVPGLLCAALGVLPEGLLLGGIGGASAFDHEPLIRAGVRCLSARAEPALTPTRATDFVEFLLVVDDQLVVIQGGRRQPRLALVFVCSREANLAWVLASCRRALQRLEELIDLGQLGVGS